MRYKNEYLNCGKASRSWIIEIQARFPTKRQSTWETASWNSDGMCIGQSLIWSIIKFWWMVRKEIGARQMMPGEFRLAR